ncbi:MAG: hypothetical protein M5U32_17590 [Myxococcota bacterium]|nr:hypothetical protein [Myxococcota bacterium]
MHLPRLALPALVVAASLLLGPGAAHAEPPVIYKWVDEHGVAHFTVDRDRIPAAIRDRVVQGSGANRHQDWLRRDVGDPEAAAPEAIAREALPGEADATPAHAKTTPAARMPDADVEVPESSDGVHAVASEPDWSEAPGGEAEWAPGDLGEDGEIASRRPEPQPDTAPGDVLDPTAGAPAEDAPRTTTARIAPAPPPPPPPLEADGTPVAAPARTRPEPDATSAARPAPAPFGTRSELPFDEPPAPAAVAAPAPRPLEPDEQLKLDELDREIAGIEGEIARDEETLMLLISETEAAEQNALVDDPRFRDVAKRLPRLQADLERLREQRARIQPSVTRQ